MLRSALVALAIFYSVSFQAPAYAVPRSRSGRAIAAMRQQEINRLQKQLENARETLERLRNTASADAADISEARSRAISARQSIEEASEAHHESHKKIDELEDRIIDEQAESSDFARALTALEQAQRALDAEMHRILKWPAPAENETEASRLKELGSLSKEQRAALKADPAYAERFAAVNAASDSLARIRRQLLEANPEWKRLSDDHRRSTQDMSEAERRRGGASNDRLNADKSLRTKAEIAALLSRTISELEARLRSLGAAPSAKGPSSPSSGGSR